MELVQGGKALPLLVEEQAFEGVKRIAAKVAQDVEKVTGVKPEVVGNTDGQAILCATWGQSPMLEKLAQEGLIDRTLTEGKREVYQITFVTTSQGQELMVICGSDKRGTIYGMFSFSEYLGVSPLCFWGDVTPAKRAQVTLGTDIAVVSKEPSVRYRGFFINDEWPCFGTWTTTHFGDFNAQAYEHVFEFLLRMKGNYLWPAMWSASFPLDGPGSANEELADIYGVVMGYSHHEPCLRASEEWDKVRGPETQYGNEWNFYTNEEGLKNYWRDALKRSGKYENLITIGMRGERDTSMLGENATVQENVNLLKDIIRKQRQLIRENVNEDLSKVPQLLALYKEVEAYFYGDETIEGLKDWEELDGVICMLCEDNHGNMRTLPTAETRNRKGGFGMYYHFDYHGGPISYEWVDSTPLSKTWEQMCMAYEYGVKEAWIVNVGDLKFHEVPLTYFLAMAYDFDKWGVSNPDSYREYTAMWAAKTFPQASEEIQGKIGQVLTEYIDINYMRRPEALNDHIYHPCNYGETDLMLERAKAVEALSTEVMNALSKEDQDAYYSMIHYSAMASMNLLKMQLYAGKNRHYAAQGRPVANYYAKMTALCIEKDRELTDAYGEFKDKKWYGMQLAQHVGFTRWNEDGYRYPVMSYVEPAHKSRLSVSRSDEEMVCVKNYGAPSVVKVDDFCYEGMKQVTIEISNDGVGTMEYTITREDGQEFPAWLNISSLNGKVGSDIDRKEKAAAYAAMENMRELTAEDGMAQVVLTCDASKLPVQAEAVRLIVSDGDTRVAVEVTGKASGAAELPCDTYLPQKGIIVMDAAHFAAKKDTAKGAYQVLENFGKYGSGVKVFPSTAVFAKDEEKPSLTYKFVIDEEGDYEVTLLCAPSNSVVNKQGMYVQVENGLGNMGYAEVTAPDFRAGENSEPRWAVGVLNQIRTASVVLPLQKGTQEITLSALEAGVVVERIMICKNHTTPKKSYCGPGITGCGTLPATL